MNIFDLNTEEKKRLEKLHASTRDGKEKDRLKAILLRSEGWSSEMISQALRLHQTTISHHLNDYHRGKLSSESGGSESKLSESQTEALIAHLTKHTYQSTESIILYVKKAYGIEYTASGFNKWLHRNGFSYKKTKGRPYKADIEEQKKFIKKYKRLKSFSDSKNPIIFMDSVHATQATKLNYGWIRTGETKEVNTSASRTRMNIIGAINLKKLSNPIVSEFDRVNSESIIDFLHQIKKEYPKSKKIHVILDQASYHRNKDVKKSAKKLKIKLHYLPPYSPNLNPIERFWKVMNEYARNNRFFKSAKDFKKAIYEFFKTTVPNIKDELISRITDNFQILKPAFPS